MYSIFKVQHERGTDHEFFIPCEKNGELMRSVHGFSNLTIAHLSIHMISKILGSSFFSLEGDFPSAPIGFSRLFFSVSFFFSAKLHLWVSRNFFPSEWDPLKETLTTLSCYGERYDVKSNKRSNHCWANIRINKVPNVEKCSVLSYTPIAKIQDNLLMSDIQDGGYDLGHSEWCKGP